MLFALYAMLHVIRAFVIFSLRPLMNYHSTYHITKAESVVLAYSGLRGAVGLLLAYSVDADNRIPEETRDRFVFYMCGIALLTLLVNGSTTGLLVRWLGLAKPSRASRAVFQQAIGRVEGRMREAVATLRVADWVDGADWDRVNKFLPRILQAIRREHRQQEANRAEPAGVKAPAFLVHTKSSFKASSDAVNALTSMAAGGSKPGNRHDSTLYGPQPTEYACSRTELIVEARRRYLNLVKRKYWELFHKGRLSGGAVEQLVDATSSCLDHLDQPLHEWAYIAPFFHKSRLNNLLSKVVCCGSDGVLRRTLAFEYELASGFAAAHTDAAPYVRGFFPLEEALCNFVNNEIQAEVAQADRAAERILSSFQEIARSIQTRVAIKSLVREAEIAAHALLEEGHIDGPEYAAIQRCIEDAYHHTDIPVERVTTEDMLQAVPFFRHLEQEVFDTILTLGKSKNYDDGDIVETQGRMADGFSLILRGTVILTSVHTAPAPEQPVAAESKTGSGEAKADDVIHARTHSSAPTLVANEAERELIESGGVLVDRLRRGDIIGALSILTGDPQAITARCVGPVATYFLPHKAVWKLLKSSPNPDGGPLRVVSSLEQVVCRLAAALVARLSLEDFQHLSPAEIKRFFERAGLMRPTPYLPMRIRGFGVLLTGTVLKAEAQPVNAPTHTAAPKSPVVDVSMVELKDGRLEAMATREVNDAEEFVPTYANLATPRESDVEMRAPAFFDPDETSFYQFGPNTRLVLIPLRFLDAFVATRKAFLETVMGIPSFVEQELPPGRLPPPPRPLLRSVTEPVLDDADDEIRHPGVFTMALRTSSIQPQAAKSLLRELSARELPSRSTPRHPPPLVAINPRGDDAASAGTNFVASTPGEDELQTPLVGDHSQPVSAGQAAAGDTPRTPTSRRPSAPDLASPRVGGGMPPMRKAQSLRERRQPPAARRGLVAHRASVVGVPGTVTPVSPEPMPIGSNELSSVMWETADGQMQETTVGLLSPGPTPLPLETPGGPRRSSLFGRFFPSQRSIREASSPPSGH